MDVIRVLPTDVIDQIAAGEVIERPASVVKELVDNAIDAGASIISVETAGGGRHLVRVVDDGCGMSATDAVRSLERHATSKLRQVDDLWGLTTMGFRGEALPSIASVSRFTMTTRRVEDLAATRIVVEGGKLVEVSEVGAPVGTAIEVVDLLWNVPVRLKFLKSEATEATHVTELVARIAMAYPELHLRLKHNGRIALEAPPDRDGFSRAQALLGTRISARMVAAQGEEQGIRVTCFLGAPELAQTTARSVQLFVGRRPVRDRGMLHALAMGYGELIPRGRYPVAVVLVDVPPNAVDVNVHPQKSEVRFSEPNVVYAAVRHVIQNGVARAPWRDEIGVAGPVVMNAIASVAPPKLPFDQLATPSAQTYSAQLKQAREREWMRTTAQTRLGLDETGPRAWVSQVKQQVRTQRAAEAERTARAWAAPRDAGDRRERDAHARELAREHAGQIRAPHLEGDRAWRSSDAASTGSAGLGDDTAWRSGNAASTGSAGLGDDAAWRSGNGASTGSGLADETAWRSGNAASTGSAGLGDRTAWRSGNAASVGTALPSGRAGLVDLVSTLPDGVAAVSAEMRRALAAEAYDAQAESAAPYDGAGFAYGSTPTPAPGFFSTLRYLGQLDLTYLVCEAEGELVLIDQHVAHERVELARLKARGESDQRLAGTQRMLFPTTIEVPPALVALAHELRPLLAQVGFEAAAAGEHTLAVTSVPGGIRHGDPAQVLRDLLEQWAADGAPSEAERLEHVLAEIACHSVVRAGDRLSASEAEALLRAMDGADFSTQGPGGGCGPHGGERRPVCLRLPLGEIARRFGR